MIAVQQFEHVVNIAGRLVVNGRSLAIGQICLNWLTLLSPCHIPASTEADLIVTVNGKEKTDHILILHEVNEHSDRVEFL